MSYTKPSFLEQVIHYMYACSHLLSSCISSTLDFCGTFSMKSEAKHFFLPH